jgi:hypothetical protein
VTRRRASPSCSSQAGVPISPPLIVELSPCRPECQDRSLSDAKGRKFEPPVAARAYDLRHTSATVALRAGLGTFELSRYMGTSLINIDRTYGHLARDSHQRATQLLEDSNLGCRDVDARGSSVDVAITSTPTTAAVHRTPQQAFP